MRQFFRRLLSNLGFFILVLVGALFVVFICSRPAVAQMMVLPGKFDVSPEGSAAFSIPISVPPGTGGMVPSLSVDYASGGGNGLLGVGWSLSGLSEITRCPQTLAQDGVRGSITYTATDRFCLDGQRLILISGTYGSAGSVYRTEVEGFSNIVAVGTAGTGPAYFTVQTKAGQTMEYGNPSASEGSSNVITNAQVMLNTIPTTAASWLLDKVTDTTGNYMIVRYVVDPDANIQNNNEVVPSEIDYTGNANAGLYPYNRVTFVYGNGTRPDIVPRYTAGALVETTQLLTDVETWSGTQSSPYSTEIYDYKLAYWSPQAPPATPCSTPSTTPVQPSATTGRSLLRGITMCDGTDSTNYLPERIFTYQSEASANFTPHTQNSGLGNYTNNVGPPTAYWTEIQGDFNGDGKSDFAFLSGTILNTYLSNGDGSFAMLQQKSGLGNYGSNGAPTAQWTLIEGDFNGDGKSDFALLQGSTLNTYLSNGDGSFTEYTQTANIGNYSNAAGAPPTAYWTLVQGDFNGDGRSDFALIQGSTLNSYFSNGDGTFTVHTTTLPQSFGSPPTADYTLIDGDFNGDGKSDFAFIDGSPEVFEGYNPQHQPIYVPSTTSTIYAYLSNGDSTFNQVTTTTPGPNFGYPPDLYWTPMTGDFNGDGLTDFAFISGGSNGQNDIYTLVSNGDGTFRQIASTNSGALGSPPSKYWSSVTGDFNGDGLTDFGFIYNNQFNTYISNGTGTFTSATQTLNAGYGTGGPPTNNYTLVSGDFNGDGLGDFGFIADTTLNSYFSTGPQPDLLLQITNGVGASTSITYGTPAEGFTSSPATSPASYSTGPFTNYYGGWNSSTCSSTLPAPANAIGIALPMPVVTSTSSSTGISSGNPYESIFTYSCARADTTGRGYLGFAQETVTDVQTGIEQTTDFLQNFPYVGLISAQTKSIGSITLNSTVNCYAELWGTSSPPQPANATTCANVTAQSTPLLPWTGTQTGEVAPQFPYLYQSVVSGNDLGETAPSVSALPTATSGPTVPSSQGVALPTATTTYTYDCRAYGATCSSTYNYGDVYTITTAKTLNGTQTSTQTTTNTYLPPNLTQWFLGRLTESQVQSTTP